MLLDGPPTRRQHQPWSKCSSRRQVASNAPSYNPRNASTTTSLPGYVAQLYAMYARLGTLDKKMLRTAGLERRANEEEGVPGLVANGGEVVKTGPEALM